MEDYKSKNFYVAVTVKENDKYYSYMVKVNERENVISKLTIKGILHANIFDTKKKCEETVKIWNDSYISNGTYMFANPSF